MASLAELGELPEGVVSLLDTDLYKLTMQCAILMYMPDIRTSEAPPMVAFYSYFAEVTYAFTNRTPEMRLNRIAFNWLREQVSRLGNHFLTPDEKQYLRETCPYFSDTYLRFLGTFKLNPASQVKMTFKPVKDTRSLGDVGDISIEVGGAWLDTILYEIPLLALTSEAYFRFCERDWDRDGQEEKAYEKATTLIEHGCNFSEFGTRRRRDYHTQELVMQGLTRAAAEGREKGLSGRLSGTSNVHFAMKHGLQPIGTVAHEWFMGIASITDDYEHASETALRYWVGCFGEGVLGIALTDTFGTPIFLKAFKKAMPNIAEAKMDSSPTTLRPEAPRPAITDSSTVVNVNPANIASLKVDDSDAKPRSYAETFTGVRQDSGDPLEFVQLMRDFYDSQGITDKKTLVFSDSLNIDLCLKYKEAAEKAGFAPTFGIGTYLTNDFVHMLTGKKSAPLNIVIKLFSASGRPAIKISDNVGKNTGDSETVSKVKESLGYKEKEWAQGDERTRWGQGDQEASAAEVQA
ncbi:uncharacterized protein KY384_001762 [Bacidia gigantensis]|uniref:uncharacterized protein n=1 Tax=Bacidia gigantensis TaxID=2732470 RepID=UPI001D054FA2|nr:uncharacterized protein KY384_001762 [Bacidia gigantensis]KAG8532980.1 hypothetical protein KY384_001762 [Bacidia gigantensis]